jgi:peptidoglycan/LPS O-acetylase OafA/YrhL
MCYTIYLYHGHLLSPLSFAMRHLYIHSLPFWINFPLQFAIQGPIILALCTLLFILIERPCMKKDWPQRLWRRLFAGKDNPSLKVPESAPAAAPDAWSDPLTSTK